MIGTIIIPHKNGNQFRQRNLLYTVRYYLDNLADIEVVISEQNGNNDSTFELRKEFGNRLIHINTEIDEGVDCLFSKSIMINVGVSNSHNEMIAMIDNDCILPPNEIYKAFETYLSNDCSVYQPFSYINYLTESQTRQYIKQGNLSQYQMSDIMPIQKYTGGVNIFSKFNFNKVSGFDEGIVGWGSEDDAFLSKMKRIVGAVKWSSETVTLIHLWHPKSNTMDYLNSAQYIKNRKLSACIQRMNDSELNNYIAECKNKSSSYLPLKVCEYESKGLLHLICKIPVSGSFITVDSTTYAINFNDKGVGTFENFCETFLLESSSEELLKTLLKLPNIINNLTDEDKSVLLKLVDNRLLINIL